MLQEIIFNLVLQYWPYLLAVVALVAIAAGIRKYELTRIRYRNRINMAGLEIRKLKELDHLKSRFFTNISHEFRTPLTLIKGPLEQHIDEEKKPENLESLKLIHSNVNRLLELINQIMDLSRIESGRYGLKVSRGDFTSFLKGVVMSFSSLAVQKNISFSFKEQDSQEFPHQISDFYFDRDVMEKIFNNLLSNAFKFTPGKGCITVKICISGSAEKDRALDIVVSDSGQGIPQGDLPFVFEKYYQSANSAGQGSGVGLAYVKELVRVHKGTIRVRSIRGKGTTFILRFPLGKEHFSPEQVLDETTETASAFSSNYFEQTPDNEKVHSAHGISANNPSANSLSTNNPSAKSLSAQGNRPAVLIVEDHTEVRDYIDSVLQKEFTVLKATNAEEGFNLSKQRIPEVIISDLMIPGTDGYEFARHIRKDEKTAHIPIIFLTALAEESDRIKGLETGADDYIVKPFSATELLARVRNLVNSRQALKYRFSERSIVVPGGISVSSRHSEFIEKIVAVVNENIDNPDFTVDHLGKESGMSRSQLHRRMKKATNMTANHFIRSVRMNRAMELLSNDAGNISEVAYMVGYDDPGYFTKTFRSYFGTPPTGIKKK